MTRSFLLLFLEIDLEWSQAVPGDKIVKFLGGEGTLWAILNCSKYVRTKCPAYLNVEAPCWEIPYTQCEILLGIKKDCKSCKVFKLYNISRSELHSATPLKKDSQ